MYRIQICHCAVWNYVLGGDNASINHSAFTYCNIGKNCPLINTELSKLTVRFPDLRANILGVKKDKFCDPIYRKPWVLAKLNFVVRCALQIDACLHCKKK